MTTTTNIALLDAEETVRMPALIARERMLAVINEIDDQRTLNIKLRPSIKAVLEAAGRAQSPEMREAAQEALNTLIRKIARLLAVMPKRHYGQNERDVRSAPPALADEGINEGEASRLRLIHLVSDDEYDELVQANGGKHPPLKALIRKGAEKKRDLIRQANEPGDGVLIHADCRDVLRKLDDASFDCLLTDPPYSTEFDDYGAFLDSWLDLAISKVTTTGTVFIWAGPYAPEIAAYIKRVGHRDDFTLGNIIVWHYKNTLGPQPKMTFKNTYQVCFYLYGPDAKPLRSPWLKDQTTVFEAAAPRGDAAGENHPWQKPSAVLETLIAVATDEGNRLLDPFAGSGAIGLAATKLGRTSLSIESDAQYVRIANGRGLHLQEWAS